MIDLSAKAQRNKWGKWKAALPVFILGRAFKFIIENDEAKGKL